MELYQVGIHLTAKDGISGVLANLSKSMLGLHGSVGQLERGISRMQLGVLGAVSVAAGVKLAHFSEKLIEHAAAMQHWRVQMDAAGASSATIADAVAASWKTAGNNLNTTATQNLKNIIELNKATGDWHESIKLMPTFAIAENVLKSVKSEDFRSRMSSTQTLNFARGLEELGVTQKGKTEEERQANIEKYVGEYVKTMISSRGLFDGNALFAMTNNSGGAAQNWDMRMATTVAPVLGEIMKASKLGNADYMSTRTYQGGHLTSDAVAALVKHHLTDPGDTWQDKRGGWHLNANSKFAEGMETNLWDWSGRVLAKMKANGIDISNQHAVNSIINEIGSNKSTTMMMRALLEPLTRLQMQKEFALRDNVPDDAAGRLSENDPWQKWDRFTKKLDDFMTALGSPMLASAMQGLDLMTKSLNQAAQFLQANPRAASIIGNTLLAASAGLVALGVTLIGGAVLAAIGTGGWLVVGIAALALAFKSFAPKQFDEWLDGFKHVAHGIVTFDWKEVAGGVKEELKAVSSAIGLGIKSAFDALDPELKGACAKLVAEITSWPGRLAAAIEKMGSDIVAKIEGAFSGLGDKISKFLHFSSFEGSGPGGGSLINASWSPANDNRGGGAIGGYGGLADDVMDRAGGAGFNTRGVRNFNPGNIGWGGWARSHGAIGGAGADSGHLVAVFPSFEAGYAAMGALALSKYGAGARSIDALIAGRTGWTPGNHEAAANVARMMGLSPTADAHLDIPSMLAKFKAALSVQELGPAGARYARDHFTPPRPREPKSDTTIHVPVHLDGKVVASAVTRIQTDRGRFPTSVGGLDTHGTFASPGTPLTDAA